MTSGLFSFKTRVLEILDTSQFPPVFMRINAFKGGLQS